MLVSFQPIIELGSNGLHLDTNEEVLIATGNTATTNDLLPVLVVNRLNSRRGPYTDETGYERDRRNFPTLSYPIRRAGSLARRIGR